LKEEDEVRGSRDDIMRFVELIVYEDREFNKLIRTMLEKEAKSLGLDKNELWSRLMNLMKTSRRAELLKLLKIDKKTSTQKLRED